LPTGAATETTLATLLLDATFTSRINTLGQKTMANSTPIVIASDQTVIPVSDNGGSITIDGTITANIGTTNGLALDTTLTNGTQKTIITNGTNDGYVLNSDPAGTEYALVVRNIPSGTQMVAGTVAATQSGTWTVQPGNTANTTPWLTTINEGGNSATVTASNALKVDGSAVTQPISAVSLPLPTGAATETTLATLLTESTFTARINTFGQKTMANSTPIVIASDQTVIPVSDNSGSLTIDTTQLPAALVAGRLDTNLGAWLGSTAPTVGQKTMTNSVPIVIASDQSAVPVSQNGTWTVQQGTPPWSVSQNGTWTVQQGTPPWSVVGPGAAGAAISGNPVRIGASDGSITRNILSDAGGRLQIVGSAASGDTVAGNPVLIGGSDGTNAQTIRTATDGTIRIDPTGTTIQPVNGTVTSDQGNPNTLANRWPVIITDGTNTGPTMDAAPRAGYVRITDGTNTIGTLFKTLYSDPNGDRRAIHNNATITSSGSTVLTWVGYSEWYLIINLKDVPTGSSPTIQFKIEQVDPIDGTTVLTDVKSWTGIIHTGVGQEILEIPELSSDSIKISWIVTGASASWTGVNVAFCGHAAGNAIEGQAEVGTIADDPPVPVAGVDSDGYIQYLNVDGSGNLKVITQTSPSSAINGLNAGYAKLGGGTAGVLIPVLSTTYNEQSSNAQRSISSSSTNDTSAGTGARTVEITYYTATFTGPFTEVVTLNGTTAVNTTNTDICYIESLIVLTSGSTGVNVGTITLYASTGGAGGAVASIGSNTLTGGTGDTRTLYAQHYVATGLTCSITGFLVSASGQCSFFLKTKDLSTANASEQIVSGIIPTSNPFERTYGTPLQVIGPARIRAYAIPSSNNNTISASIDFYEE